MGGKKKYNPNKLLITNAKRLVNQYAVGYMAGEDNCFALDISSMATRGTVPANLMHSLSVRQDWTMHLLCLCVGSDHKPYIKGADLTISSPLSQAELLPSLNAAHAELIAQQNKKHFIRPAWLAYAGVREFNIDAELPRVLEMFEQRGGFTPTTNT